MSSKNFSAYGDAISFYIQLLPGDYDPILRWPFDSKILFSLYDQNVDVTKRLDFRYELVPNIAAVRIFLRNFDSKNLLYFWLQLQINHFYVGRPSLEQENGLLGVEAFVSLDQLFDGSYIRNDTLIVGISIYD